MENGEEKVQIKKNKDIRGAWNENDRVREEKADVHFNGKTSKTEKKKISAMSMKLWSWEIPISILCYMW